MRAPFLGGVTSRCVTGENKVAIFGGLVAACSFLLVVQHPSVGEEKAHILNRAIGFLQVQLDVEGPLRVQYRRPTKKRTAVGVRISNAKLACRKVAHYGEMKRAAKKAKARGLRKDIRSADTAL
jgi:hypothetical protein